MLAIDDLCWKNLITFVPKNWLHVYLSKTIWPTNIWLTGREENYLLVSVTFHTIMSCPWMKSFPLQKYRIYLVKYARHWWNMLNKSNNFCPDELPPRLFVKNHLADRHLVHKQSRKRDLAPICISRGRHDTHHNDNQLTIKSATLSTTLYWTSFCWVPQLSPLCSV